MQRFGEKLRVLRKQRGLTMEELALEMGLTGHGHISNVETGKKKPSLEFVLKVAEIFEVSLDQLLRDELDLEGKAK